MTIRVLRGHCIDVLADLPPQSVHAVVTSPPYFRARRYGCPPQVWPDPDGREPCAEGAHEWVTNLCRRDAPPISGSSTLVKGQRAQAQGQMGTGVVETEFCARCGSWRGELGWECRTDAYIGHLVQVFRACRRVLRDDGCLWVNIAGGYANEASGQNGSSGGVSEKAISANRQAGRTDKTGGLPPLNWIDVPGLLGAAMQADGWVWRSYVHLVKRSPLPESVTGIRWERCRIKMAASGRPRNSDERDAIKHGRLAEMAGSEWADCPGCPKCEKTDNLVLRRGAWRPTRATEALLLFVKGGSYWSDQEAVRAANQPPPVSGINRPEWEPKRKDGVARESFRMTHRSYNPVGHNPYDWMDWPSREAAFQGAHYAAYPPDLAAWCIKASVPERCCPACGAGYARVVDRRYVKSPVHGPGSVVGRHYETGANNWDGAGYPRVNLETTTLGWRPTCSCKDAGPPTPGTVLDPFSGAGSTLLAADRLGRHGMGIDLNPSYTDLSAARIRGDAPLLAEVLAEVFG